MNVIRLAGRACFAAVFVAHGWSVASRPPEQLAATQATLDRLAPLLRRVLPRAWADKVPTEAANLSRTLGAIEAAAGVCYGLSILPRTTAGVLAAAVVPQVVTAARTPDAAERRRGLTQSLALLGGAVVATQEGRTRVSAARRAVRGAKALGRGYGRYLRGVGTVTAVAGAAVGRHVRADAARLRRASANRGGTR